MTALCLIRKLPIAHTPEESVRQSLLHWMVNEGGYPEGLIAVEKKITDPQAPLRRIDILVYSKQFNPLLLIECKAVDLNASVLRQVIGYNAFIKAPFIAIANHKEIKLGKYHKEGWVFSENLPQYLDLQLS